SRPKLIAGALLFGLFALLGLGGIVYLAMHPEEATVAVAGGSILCGVLFGVFTLMQFQELVRDRRLVITSWGVRLVQGSGDIVGEVPLTNIGGTGLVVVNGVERAGMRLRADRESRHVPWPGSLRVRPSWKAGYDLDLGTGYTHSMRFILEMIDRLLQR